MRLALGCFCVDVSCALFDHAQTHSLRKDDALWPLIRALCVAESVNANSNSKVKATSNGLLSLSHIEAMFRALSDKKRVFEASLLFSVPSLRVAVALSVRGFAQTNVTAREQKRFCEHSKIDEKLASAVGRREAKPLLLELCPLIVTAILCPLDGDAFESEHGDYARAATVSALCYLALFLALKKDARRLMRLLESVSLRNSNLLTLTDSLRFIYSQRP